MNLDTVNDQINVLDDEVRHLGERLDQLDPGTPAADTLNRRIDVLYGLLTELRDKRDEMEDGCARWRAEQRLAHHIEHDTLDMH